MLKRWIKAWNSISDVNRRWLINRYGVDELTIHGFNETITRTHPILSEYAEKLELKTQKGKTKRKKS